MISGRDRDAGHINLDAILARNTVRWRFSEVAAPRLDHMACTLTYPCRRIPLEVCALNPSNLPLIAKTQTLFPQ